MYLIVVTKTDSSYYQCVFLFDELDYGLVEKAMIHICPVPSQNEFFEPAKAAIMKMKDQPFAYTAFLNDTYVYSIYKHPVNSNGPVEAQG